MNNLKQPSLQQIQQWMKTILTVRGSLREKLATAATPDNLHLEQIVKTQQGVSPYRRLDIYAAGYVMRLVECLKSEFSVLCAYMGDEFFETFAKAYIVTVPSENWSLYYLGEHFSDFLKNTQPQGLHAPEQVTFIALPAQIAQFERAYAEVLLAKGLENNTDILASKMGYELAFLQGQIMLQTPPCLRLIKLDYPILELMNCVEKSEDYTLPQPEKSLLALTRVDYRVTATELDDWQFSFLTHCKEAMSVHKAVQITAIACGISTSDLLAKLMIWLPIAQSSGFLVSL